MLPFFLRAGLLEYEIALNLSRYLKKEKSHVPWQAFLNSIEFLKGMLSSKEAYVHLQVINCLHKIIGDKVEWLWADFKNFV